MDDIHFKSSRIIVGLQEHALAERVLLSPNPTKGFTSVRFKKDLPLAILVYNLSGQKVLTLGNPTTETTLDLSNQPPGLYVVKIIGAKTTETLKLIRK